MSLNNISKRKLILIKLLGGFDGLAAFVPLDQLPLYYQLRATLGVAEANLLSLDSAYPIGLHPSAAPARELMQRGLLRLINNVGYPEFNKSHFESTDLVVSGGDGNGPPSMGGSIIGRYLEKRYPSYPNGFPNALQRSPAGYGSGTAIPKTIWGSTGPQMGIRIIGNPSTLFDISLLVNQAKGMNSGLSNKERLVSIINDVDTQADAFGAELKRAYEAGVIVEEFAGTSISSQLENVAKLIKGGSDTEIFVVSIGVFDTHNDQAIQGDNTKGTFASAIEDVFSGMLDFQTEMMSSGLADDILCLTVSEFGRRAKENGLVGSGKVGTDHGTSYPMLMMGTGVIPGVSGPNPNLSDLDENNDLKGFSFDYRDVFKTALKWLGAGPVLLKAAGVDTFTELPIIDQPFPEAFLDLTYAGIKLGDSGGLEPKVVPPPLNLRLVSVDHQGFDIAWDTPQDISNVAGYRVEINGGSFQESDPLTASVSGVAPDTDYFIKVWSLAPNGDLSVPATLSVRTDPEPKNPTDPIKDLPKDLVERVEKSEERIGNLEAINEALREALNQGD